ncbi:DUF4440 domain-containing protein [Alkalilimnicola ehrlichii]|uniref:DUF4440 domain-containing protein n=1 Tax=Alkalilimnicola ehrlichii TaxID=351052 RepID=A0A3E0X1T3_9GAMM|nr:DUF4440 domain-containing protein [Alkalilimnicola ehrlichii]RFA38686.1 DUF4440 domain-containing protein [Alkalilimnicola ehrlichii]
MTMQDINLPAVVAEVAAAFAQYEEALVSNDVDVLDALFWRDERTVRYGVGENLYGFAAIAAFRAGRPASGLARSLRNTVITTFGTDYATVWTEFSRPGVTRVGRQSQCWARMQEGWRIVAAHVSLMEQQ